MGKRLKKLKKIRLHHEGTHTLVWGAAGLIALNLLLFYAVPTRIPFNIAFFLSIIVYSVVVNFYRCPIRIFDHTDILQLCQKRNAGTGFLLIRREFQPTFHRNIL